MKKVNVIFSDKSLVAILGALILVIIGLGVGIWTTQTHEEPNYYILPNGENISVGSATLYEELEERFQNEADFTAEMATEIFDERIKETDNNYYKLNLAIWAANYINKYGGGPQAAAQYLLGYNYLLKLVDQKLLVSYYNAMSYFYNEAEDVEKADYYKKMSEETTSKLVGTVFMGVIV